MNDRLYHLMNWPKIEEIVYSESDHPHEILGPHRAGAGWLIQAFFPGAEKVKLILYPSGTILEMEQADEAGYFAQLVSGRGKPDYKYSVEYPGGRTCFCKDPYSFEPAIGQRDLEKFKHGIHYTLYRILGANVGRRGDTEGVSFAVWAPNAMRVSVVGDFNGWDGRIHQMSRQGDSGIFEIFIPQAKAGDCYKFELKLKNGLTYLKADPYGRQAQLRPDNASVIASGEEFAWEDADFIKRRQAFQGGNAPISIYELYLGSVAPAPEGEPYANYRQLAQPIIEHVKEMGYTHVELMPVMEHPFDGSWGYQIIGYYAPTARYGSPEDFKYLINELHKAGIGVILDWVPAHFPKDNHGLAAFDGTCLYEHLDPRQGCHPHWGTLIYNYGRPQVSNYLIANALYWVEYFHADGIRMDAVASMLYLDYGREEGAWIPNMYGGRENLEAIEFIKHLNSIMKKRNPGVLSIAEESTAFPLITGSLAEGGLGFDLKWNMGFMNDYLGYIRLDPYFRSHHHGELTFSMIYVYSEKFITVFSHDEVVHGKGSMLGKMPGDEREKMANLRLTYAYMMTHPGRKLLFMGQDIGEDKEWSEARGLELSLLEKPLHRGLAELVGDLNRLYTSQTALHELDDEPAGFEWINFVESQACRLIYARWGKKKNDLLVVAANFAGVEQELSLGVPKAGKYKEILNTDDVKYGGEGRTNKRVKKSRAVSVDGRNHSISIKLAPLSVAIFRYEEEKR